MFKKVVIIGPESTGKSTLCRWFLGRIFYYPEGGVYFGVPLSNFAGWMIVGMVGVGGYLCGVCVGVKGGNCKRGAG